MSTEQNQPEASQGDAQLSQQGQGPGQHRRRRRRRKNKGGAQAEGQSAPEQQQPKQQQSQPRQQQPQKAKSSQNRYFQKNNNGNSNGNGNGNGGGQRRKSSGGGGKQRKQQVFVGPMDHVYRGANGNVADSPPSTIDLRMVNGNVGSYGNEHTYYEAAAPAPAIREDAPTRIYCFIEDLFFLAKIQEVSKKTGVKVAFVKAEKEVLAKLTDGNEEERPALIVFDLNNVGAKPLTTIPKLRAKLKKGKTSIIGFLSHIQGDLKVKAIEAGCDTVMPRSAFSQNLPNLMRRHGAEEEEEEYGMAIN